MEQKGKKSFRAQQQPARAKSIAINKIKRNNVEFGFDLIINKNGSVHLYIYYTHTIEICAERRELKEITIVGSESNHFSYSVFFLSLSGKLNCELNIESI